MYAETAEGMLDFIKHSPTAFHAVENMNYNFPYFSYSA